VLVKPNELVCANAGDSRAILVRSREIVELSIDHKPCQPEEKKRILKMGGRIETFKD
jgi:serine/threonine protein phosphatase PrpC